MKFFYRWLERRQGDGDLFHQVQLQNILKRLSYLTASLVGLPSIIWALWFNIHSAFWRLIYGGLLVCLAIWTAALFHPRVSLRSIERFVLIVILAFAFSKHVYLFYFSNLSGMLWLWEVQSVYWTLAIGFILAYVVFHRKAALWLCLGTAGLALLVTLPQLSRFDPEIWREFFRLEVRLVVVALVILFLARAKDDLLETQGRALQAEVLANRDPLTGLHNRRAMTQMVEENLAKRETFSLIIADIDYFKTINDTHGHRVGDRVLQDVALFFRHNLRDGDIVGRWGGEEFVILLFQDDAEVCQQTAERLRTTIKRTPMASGVVVSLSLGGTMRLKNDTMESLFDRADQALYVAKRLGRNRVEWT